MTMPRFLFIIISSVFVNNFLMSRFLGCCPFLGVSRKLDTAVGMGVAVTFVMTMASAFSYMVYSWILVPLHMEYLYTIAFILVIASLVQFVEMVIQKVSATLYSALGIYLPLITTNCAVLGVAVLNMQEGYSLWESVLNGFSAAVGFTMVMVLFAGIRERIEHNRILSAFQGFPIALIAAGLMAIAFLGFQGLI